MAAGVPILPVQAPSSVGAMAPGEAAAAAAAHAAGYSLADWRLQMCLEYELGPAATQEGAASEEELAVDTDGETDSTAGAKHRPRAHGCQCVEAAAAVKREPPNGPAAGASKKRKDTQGLQPGRGSARPQ